MYKNIPAIKRKLIESRGYKCEECSLTEWRGKSITLEMDHIDGDSSNNIDSNLRLLCPNCHSQTKTWKKKKNTIVTDEQLLIAIESTDNIRQALISVGLTPKGKNYTRAYALLNISKKVLPVDTKNSQFGTVWINKDQINKKIKAEILSEYIDQGWKRGRCWVTLHKAPRKEKGTYWITDGNLNKSVNSIEIIPDGWRRGRTHIR